MPSPAELARAIDCGAPVRMGYPTAVDLDGGGVAVLDLAMVERGELDPWLHVHAHGPVTEQATWRQRLLTVAGHVVAPRDLGAVDEALAAAPPGHARHSRAGDLARLAAGTAALRIRDVMLRAAVLDAVDGWTALESAGEVRDDDPRHGRLIAIEQDGIRTGLLIVACPTTGRRYGLPVPITLTTAREARMWTMHGIDPEVET